MVSHPSNHDILYELLMKFKKIFVKGGPKRIKYTIPALIFSLIRLSQDMYHNQFTGNYNQAEEVKGDDEEEEAPANKVTQKKIYSNITELIVLITPH